MLHKRLTFLTQRKTISETEAAQLHSAGATVVHASKFSNLQVYRNDQQLDQDFLNQWVIPYCSILFRRETEDLLVFAQAIPHITGNTWMRSTAPIRLKNT